MRPVEPGKNGAQTTWSLAKRALACAKPRCRTSDQVHDIAELLIQQKIFEGLQRDDLLAVAYFIEAKHSEAGECILSKGQPLEQWCLLLDGNVQVTRYSSLRGSEQTTCTLGPNESWSEAALLHSSHPRRSFMTVVAGQQGCITLRLRYTDYDAINDLRNPLQLLPAEGTQGPLVVLEVSVPHRRTGSLALLCCFLRRLASSRGPDVRTPEEVAELEPFLSSLPAYRAYPPELIACLATACRTLTLPPGSLVYERDTLADAQVTVLSGDVQVRRFGTGTSALEEGGGGDETPGVGTTPAPTPAAGPNSCSMSSINIAGAAGGGGSAAAAGSVTPSPPPGSAGHKPQEGGDGSGSRLSIRARLRREREARKLMQRQLDEYVARMESAEALAGAGLSDDSSRDAKERGTTGGSGSGPVDWTRVFMQKAMRTAEPVWKALHPADNMRRRRQPTGDGTFDNPFDEGPITEVAQLLGPAAAKAYYRGLQSQGYSDTDSPAHAASPARPSETGSGGAGGPSGAEPSTVRERWRRWMFSVDGPETKHQRTLRNMAMSASRIIRDQHARSRRSNVDAEELEEMYGPLVATLTRGSPVGELSTVNVHSCMRKESAVAGARGCELLLVDWEAYQQGVLAARAALLGRAAPFLATLSKERLTELAELCLCLVVDAGTLLARQGGVLESLVVVQSGELQLLHEPSAALHTRLATLKGHAVSRSRNGRTYTMPLLATLSQTHVPGFSPASTPGPGVPSPPGPASTPGPPASSAAPPPGSSSPTELTIQGLPLGEIGVAGILGEGLLGLSYHGGGHSHLDPSQCRGGKAVSGDSMNHAHTHAHGANALGDAGGGGGSAAGGSALAGSPAAAALAPPGEGPKWPATVLASKSSVLLVIPRSVLYMGEFDALRGHLMRYAVERKAQLAKRVEAAYREASAPPTTPAVFANGAGGGGPGAVTTGSGGSGSPASPQLQQPLPSLRRSVLSGAGGAACGSGGGADGGGGGVGDMPRRAASGDLTGSNDAVGAGGGGGGGGPLGLPPSRRRSNDVLQRSSSPAVGSGVPTSLAAAAAAAGAQGGGGGSTPRVSTKWDFLDGPNAAAPAPGALTAEPSGSFTGPLLGLSHGSLPRAGYNLGAPPPLLLDGCGGSFTAGAGVCSPFGGLPLRRPSSASLRAIRDASASASSSPGPAAPSAGFVSLTPLDMAALTPVQQALLDAGLDPALGAEGSLGEVAGGRRHSVIANSGGGGGGMLPVLAPPLNGSLGRAGPAPSRLSPGGGAPGGGGGVSPCASMDFDAMRSPAAAPPLRSPNALTPLVRRASSGLPPGGPAPSSLLDHSFGSTVSAAPPLTPGAAPFPVPMPGSAQHHGRASYSGGGAVGVVRRAELDAVVAVGAVPGSPRLTGAVLPLQSIGLSPSRVPGLAAVDLLESTATLNGPSSPGLYTRNPRASYTSGMGGRRASMDCLWLSTGEAARRGGLPTAARGAPGRGAAAAAGAGSGGGDAEMAELEEEEALARSLVPKNQAGNFMVREGASSTPSKQPAVRRIANCF